jgi:hypothetical protein
MSVAPKADAAGVKNIVVDMARLPAVRAGEAPAISGEERLQDNHRYNRFTFHWDLLRCCERAACSMPLPSLVVSRKIIFQASCIATKMIE